MKEKKVYWIIGGLFLLVYLTNPTLFEKESVKGYDLTGHTSTFQGHSHTYSVDSQGNGQTSVDDGHSHDVFQFIVLEADGHTHVLAR